MTTTVPILLFSYGTVQDKNVQMAHFGRELAAADQYEVADYKRVSVDLKSGLQAWVYVRA